MRSFLRCIPVSGVAASAMLLTGTAYAGDVDVLLTPVVTPVEQCEIIEIDLVLTAPDGNPQPYDALDAILSWDPAVLEFVDIDNSRATGSYFVRGFLNDPDGINDDIQDGTSLFTALVSAGNPIDVPGSPGELIVTTFRFQPLMTYQAGTLSLLPELLSQANTEVYFKGTIVTGVDDDDAEVQEGTCVADVNVDGVISILDLLRVLTAWGPCGGCCPEDFDTNGVVNIVDLLEVLIRWGACPLT